MKLFLTIVCAVRYARKELEEAKGQFATNMAVNDINQVLRHLAYPQTTEAFKVVRLVFKRYVKELAKPGILDLESLSNNISTIYNNEALLINLVYKYPSVCTDSFVGVLTNYFDATRPEPPRRSAVATVVPSSTDYRTSGFAIAKNSYRYGDQLLTLLSRIHKGIFDAMVKIALTQIASPHLNDRYKALQLIRYCSVGHSAVFSAVRALLLGEEVYAEESWAVAVDMITGLENKTVSQDPSHQTTVRDLASKISDMVEVNVGDNRIQYAVELLVYLATTSISPYQFHVPPETLRKLRPSRSVITLTCLLRLNSVGAPPPRLQCKKTDTCTLQQVNSVTPQKVVSRNPLSVLGSALGACLSRA